MRSPRLALRAAAVALALAVAAGPALAPAPAAAAEEMRPIFYNLTTDDAWAAGMALAQANAAAGRGHTVTVFLNVRAVHLADRDAAQGTFGPSGNTPAALLAALMEKGQTVLVCGMCMRAGGMKADDLIEGAAIATPDLTFGAMTAPDAVVVSY